MIKNVDNESARPLLDEGMSKDAAIAITYAVREGACGGNIPR